MDVPEGIRRLGIIAGNGPLPTCVAKEAVRLNIPVTVAAIKEETAAEIEEYARESQGQVRVHWMGVGQLGRLLRVFREDGVDKAVMVGQVRHVRIFAPGSRSPFSQLHHLPDARMLRLLASLKMRNTGSLIGGIIRTLEEQGFELLDSTCFLRGLLASSGVMTRRSPTKQEKKDFEYGRPVALEIARLDLGQTLVVKDSAVVAVEAMEGTDATIQRASGLVGGESLTVIKVSRPNQDMRFDVPVVGPRTMQTLRRCHVTALAIDSGRTLMLEKKRFLAEADDAGIAVVGF